MDERTIFVDEFQDATSKDGNWLTVSKLTESAESSCGANSSNSEVFKVPIYILFLFNLAFDTLFRRFLSESVNLLFGPCFELDSDMFLSLTIISIRMRGIQVQQRSYEYGNLRGNYCLEGNNSCDLLSPLLYSNASWKTNFIAFFKCFKQV